MSLCFGLAFDIMRFTDFLTLCGSIWHLYTSYRIRVDKPGKLLLSNKIDRTWSKLGFFIFF